MFTRSFLNRVRKRAIRNRVWWRVLDRVERAMVDLTIRVVDRVRSETLGVELVKILKKLRDALKSPFVRLMESYGVSRATCLSDLALSWGNSGAEGWANDFNFIRYLTVLETYYPLGTG